MAQPGPEFTTELELRLREGLPALRSVASEMGAKSVSVFLVKDGRTIRNLYAWPEPAEECVEVPLESALGDSLRNFTGYAPEKSPIARFLGGAFQQRGTSFLLSSCGTQRRNTTIAFGFLGTPIQGDIPYTVRLAVVAAWSVSEVLRLEAELALVNDRLGKRKLVERAKGMLQVERGLDEQQAYEHLRRLSRQRRVRMSEIARDLLGTSN
jgi:hypothetical protein